MIFYMDSPRGVENASLTKWGERMDHLSIFDQGTIPAEWDTD